jgi:hypothetical protein
MSVIKENRLGRIRIDRYRLEKDYDWILNNVMSRMLIVRCKNDYKRNVIEYEGYSELFDRVERTEEGYTTRAKYYELSIFEQHRNTEELIDKVAESMLRRNYFNFK